MKRFYLLICWIIITGFIFAEVLQENVIRAGIQVVSVTPSKNSADAAIHTNIKINFNSQVNPASLSDLSIALFGSISGKHPGIITLDNNNQRVTFQPASQFTYGEIIAVTLTSAISSTDGSQLSGGYSWKFQTATLLGSDTFKVASKVIIPALAPYALATGDFNRDGYPDLVVVNTNNNSISVYFNNKVGGFQAPQSYTAGTSPSKIAVADINNDGAVDLIVVNTGANSVGVFKNNGLGGFGTMVSYSVGATPKALSVSDINNDGFLDIAVANSSDNTLTVLKNDGTGSFTPAQTITVGTGPSAVVLADLNNDGAIDGVVSNKSSRSLTILKNVTGILVVDTTYVLTGLSYLFSQPNDIAIFDFDKDGTPDIAVANDGPSTDERNIVILLNAYLGSRPGRFTFYGQKIPVYFSPVALYGNDFDGDGDIDLCIALQNNAGITNSITIIINNGLGNIPPLIDIPVGFGTRAVVGADFSGQFGVIDLIAAGTDGKLRTFRNQVRTKPAGTVKLSAQQIAFGETTVGDTARTTVSIYSLLVANKVDSVSISNSAFSLVHSLPALLNAYDSSSVKIAFAPKSSGVFSDTLQVYCNSPTQVITIPLSGVGTPVNGVMEEKLLPQIFSLAQNYPNPFNPATTINYVLPNAGIQYVVSLRVYDLLGREEAVLVNGLKGPGKYSVTWDATCFSSGMYLYSLTANPIGRTTDKMFIATKKLILIK